METGADTNGLTLTCYDLFIEPRICAGDFKAVRPAPSVSTMQHISARATARAVTARTAAPNYPLGERVRRITDKKIPTSLTAGRYGVGQGLLVEDSEPFGSQEVIGAGANICIGRNRHTAALRHSIAAATIDCCRVCL